MNDRDDGFTLIEIGVIVPIIMLLAIGVFSVMFNLLLSSNQDQIRLNQSYTQASALDRIEADVRLSTAFLSNKDSSLYDPYQPSGGWNYAGSNGNRVLILREFSTSNNPLSNIRMPVYVRNAASTSCATAADIARNLTYNIIYFVNNGTLYRRIITDRSALSCSPQYQKLSCPSVDTLMTSRDSACQADDEEVASNVSGVSIDYYSSQASANALSVYGGSDNVSGASSIKITIENQQSSYGGKITSSSSIKIPNQNVQTGGAG